MNASIYRWHMVKIATPLPSLFPGGLVLQQAAELGFYISNGSRQVNGHVRDQTRETREPTPPRTCRQTETYPLLLVTSNHIGRSSTALKEDFLLTTKPHKSTPSPRRKPQPPPRIRRIWILRRPAAGTQSRRRQRPWCAKPIPSRGRDVCNARSVT